jgi:excisionase family DNA binding protein
MYLSIKEAARFLNVSENKVRGYIASGRLSTERKGRQVLIPELQLKALRDAEKSPQDGESQADLDSLSALSGEEAVNLLLNRLAALEGQIVEKWKSFAENQQLHGLIRRQDQELAEKKLEIEKLHRDLVYQKRLYEKEIQDQCQAFQEKWDLMEKESRERMAREQERLEARLIEERNAWSAKLAQEQERFAQKLATMRNQEGFWSRLMKMLTWS